MIDSELPKFVSFEGIDFSGKTTQIELLIKRLTENGYDVKSFRDPGGPRISEQIRKILLNPEFTEMVDRTEVLLYEAARAQLTGEQIIPALEQGKFVVIDRYFDSTTAYQGFGRGLDIHMIQQLNLYASHGLKPSLTFFLDIQMDVFNQRKRGKKRDRLESNEISFFRKVREGYLKLAEQEPDRVKVIEGNRDIHTIASEIWHMVQQKFRLKLIE